MTVAISLGEKQFVSVIEQRDSKLIYADRVHKWFASYFRAKRMEVWKNATDEALGGVMLDKIPIGPETRFLEAATKAISTKGASLDNLILLVRGVWEDQKNNPRFPAYMSINLQDKWADIYGDIEVNVFASGEVEDIVQLLWGDEEIRSGLVENFTKEFADYDDKAINTESIVYALGVPSEVSVRNWKASYFKNPNFYFLKFLSSLQSDYPDLNPYVRLMNHSVLASDLYRTTFFTDIIERIGKETNVGVDYSNSISLLGRKLESYGTMYEELSKSIFQILSKSLELDKSIDARISAEVSRMAGFDIDSLKSKDTSPSDSS